MEYDDLLTDYLGEFGIYQIVCFVLISLTILPTAFTSMGIVFIAAVPEHWCYVPELDDMTENQRKSLSVPFEKSEEGDKFYTSCKMYKR